MSEASHAEDGASRGKYELEFQLAQAKIHDLDEVREIDDPCHLGNGAGVRHDVAAFPHPKDLATVETDPIDFDMTRSDPL
jgi:hypothetical protein